MVLTLTETGVKTGPGVPDGTTAAAAATQSKAPPETCAADLSDDDRPPFGDDEDIVTAGSDSDEDESSAAVSKRKKGTASAARSGRPVKVIPLKTFAPMHFSRATPLKRTLTRAPLGYSAERAPLGGGRFCPPCLTPELIGAARRARRRSKALNEKIPMQIKNFL